ncbi:uncharacterized protein LOC144150164 [Haemaphysalis longicornis]
MSTTAALQKSNAVLTAYNGSVIKHLGVATTALEINGARKETNFFIVKKGRQAIVGLSTCREIGLIPATVDTIGRSGAEAPETEFAHLFRGTGCVKRKYKMVLRPDAVPVVQPARRVPLALKEPLRDELARMEKAAIIVKVEEPTEWFVPGKDLLLADMLSRAPAYASEPATTEDVEVHAVQVVSGIGRQLRTNVPEYRAELGSAVVKHKHQDKGKPLPLLQRGETVRIRDDDWSRKARVLHEVSPRSHIVETEDGRLLRRNRQHLLRTQEEFRAMPDDGNSHDAEGDNAQVVSQGAQVPGSIQSGLATRSLQAKDPGVPELQNETRETAGTPGATTEGRPSTGTRRSTRQRSEPKRLRYDESFRLIS